MDGIEKRPNLAIETQRWIERTHNAAIRSSHPEELNDRYVVCYLEWLKKIMLPDEEDERVIDYCIGVLRDRMSDGR